MIKKFSILIVVIFCLFLFSAQIPPILADNSNDDQISEKNFIEIACEASNGVADVKKTFNGNTGAPILIFEENHASREGQIQQAIVLVRIHENYSLNHIALEGYLKDGLEIDTEWFADDAQNLTERATVAVSLLKEGEISEAEFMKLVYEDINLYPIETSLERQYTLNDSDYETPLRYILKIAIYSLSDDNLEKLLKLVMEFQEIKEDKDPELFEEKYAEIFDFILSADPWAEDKINMFIDINASATQSLEEELELLNDIVERADSLSVELSSEEKESMELYVNFLKARINASKIMARSTGEIADMPDVSAVAMIVGAAHTESICSDLMKEDRSFAVIRPLSINNVDMSTDMFERKYTRNSIYSKGALAEALEDSFPLNTKMKPLPVLQEPWLQAKAELYLFTDMIATGILSSSGSDRPPYDFDKNKFRGKWVSIDPNEIEVVSDAAGGGNAVLFPATLNPNDAEKRKVIWIKARLGSATIDGIERTRVESMLKRALEEVRTEALEEEASVKSDRIQMTFNVVAGIAKSKSECQELTLGTI